MCSNLFLEAKLHLHVWFSYIASDTESEMGWGWRVRGEVGGGGWRVGWNPTTCPLVMLRCAGCF